MIQYNYCESIRNTTRNRSDTQKFRQDRITGNITSTQLVEKLYKENQELRKENQALKDELNILKGEQAKPKFKKGKDKTNTDISSERNSILEAGKIVSDYIQTDTTECNENGEKKQVHVFSSDLFSVFYTKEDRKRASIIDILRFCEKVEDRLYTINNEFFEIIKSRGVAIKHQSYLEQYRREKFYTHEEIQEILRVFDSKKNLSCLFYDVAYIAGFHAEASYPTTQVLLTDDASVYDHISLVHALCWIHDT